MKKVILLSLLALASACSTSVKSFYVVDENKIAFDTFSFYARNDDNLRPKQQELDSLIELSVSEVLIEKGFSKANYPEAYLSYKITLGTSSTTSIDQYQRYGSNYYPGYNTNTTHYKEGVLLIEIYSKDDKLLWQGSKSFKVGKSKNTQLLLLEMAREITSAFKLTL